MPAAGARRRRLGELLVEGGLLDEVKLQAALAEQRKWGGRLGRTVVEMGFVAEAQMVRVLAVQLNLPTIDLDNAKLPERITEHLRLDLAERYGVFPVNIELASKSLQVATSDPTNVEALQELEFATNVKIMPVVAAGSAIDRAIRRYYFGENTVATSTATPQELGVAEATFELNQLLEPLAVPISAPRAPPSAPKPVPAPVAAPPPTAVDVQLRRELTVLREQVDTLERLNASQVKALRTLLEILISSGLMTRDEYIERLHRGED